MSRKNNLLKYQPISAGDMSGNITSGVTSIQYLDNIGVQFNFTGAPTGTFQIQVSADYAQDEFGNVQNAGNWIPITFSSNPVAAGSAGSVYVDLNQLSAPWMRLAYVFTSGSGSLNAFITAKML